MESNTRRGRPQLPEGERLKVRGLRRDDKQWKQLHELDGLRCLREAIERTHARRESRLSSK